MSNPKQKLSYPCALLLLLVAVAVKQWIHNEDPTIVNFSLSIKSLNRTLLQLETTLLSAPFHPSKAGASGNIPQTAISLDNDIKKCPVTRAPLPVL